MSEVRFVAVPVQGNVPQQNSYKKERHIANAAVHAAGLGTSVLLLSKGIDIANSVRHSELLMDRSSTSPINKFAKLKSTVFQFFEGMGEKIFKKGTKLGDWVEASAKKSHLESVAERYAKDTPGEFAAFLKNSKTRGAMLLTFGVTTAGLITRAIYKAGKINAES